MDWIFTSPKSTPCVKFMLQILKYLLWRTAFGLRYRVSLKVFLAGWLLCSLVTGCGRIQPKETTDTVDLNIVTTFFHNLGEEQHIINIDSRRLTEEELHVFRWVIAAVADYSDALGRDYEIREIRLSKTTVGSPAAYKLRRHIGQGFSELAAGQFYIQLHAVHAASDPELHGVIDLQGPKLLSFWAEGA